MLNKFSVSKKSTFFTFIVSVLLFCFIFSLSSCMSTETYTIKDPKTIEHEGVITIKDAITKDNKVYNFKESQAQYKKNFKNNKEVIVYTSDSLITDSTVHKISREKYLLFLNDISMITYDRTHTFMPGVVATTLVVTALAAFFLWFLFLKDFNVG